MESVIRSARMVTYCLWNDHDNFKSFIIGNRFPLLYWSVLNTTHFSTLYAIYFNIWINEYSVDTMTALFCWEGRLLILELTLAKAGKAPLRVPDFIFSLQGINYKWF